MALRRDSDSYVSVRSKVYWAIRLQSVLGSVCVCVTSRVALTPLSLFQLLGHTNRCGGFTNKTTAKHALWSASKNMQRRHLDLVRSTPLDGSVGGCAEPNGPRLWQTVGCVWQDLVCLSEFWIHTSAGALVE